MDGDSPFEKHLRLTHLLRPAVSAGIAVWVLFVADVGTLGLAGVTVDGRLPVLVFAAAFATTPLWNSYRPEDLLDD